MVRIDLLPKEERAKRGLPFKIPTLRLRVPMGGGTFFAIALIALIFGGLGIYYLSQVREMNRLEVQIQEMKKELGNLQKIVNEVNELKKKEADFKMRLGVIEELNQNRFLRAHLLDEIKNRVPEFLWLHSLSEDNLSITLEGRSFSNFVIADFMNRLKASPYLEKIDLPTVSKELYQGQAVMRFRITATLTLYQPPSPTALSGEVLIGEQNE